MSKIQDPSGVQLVLKAEDFFRELVTDSLNRQRVTVEPETEFYVVKLLNQFIATENLYSRDQNGQIQDQPLALMVKDALEDDSPEHQRLLFRRLGDVSLYTAGYFQESLNRKLVDIDYYVSMGQVAYRNVASRATSDIRPIYEELTEKFSNLVEVLADVSDRTSTRTEKDILRLYEVYLKTGSERVARQLEEAGIVPTTTAGDEVQ